MTALQTPYADVVTAIVEVARRQPDQLAIVDDDGEWTYADLSAELHRRADVLGRAGIGAEHRVALIAESSAQYLATALAVWKAGAVLVTVYPSSSDEDIEYALRTCDPALVVYSSKFDTALVDSAVPGTPTTPVDSFEPGSARDDTAPNPAGLREPLALICFSSGTTSRPKAIMVSAATIHNTAATYGEVWHLSPEDRGIVCLPMAWLYGLASTSLALLVSGGTVVVVRRARPESIIAASTTYRATFLAGVTVTYAKLVQYAADHGLGDAFGQLRLCIAGGEPRNEVVFARWLELTGVAVLDAYCASECLPLVTYDPQTDPLPKPGSAGKVVPRAKLKVLTPEGAEVARGEVGEAFSSGPGLMLGYWQNPELTAEVITEDGWYRTRDLVRVDEDGYVYVVGRLTDLIIRGGTNISPLEIETVLNEHPSVAAAAVVGLPDEIYGQQVVAAVVPRGSFDQEDVLGFLRTRLSSYKVPSHVVAVDELPVNSTTGKVNKKLVAAQLSGLLTASS